MNVADMTPRDANRHLVDQARRLNPGFTEHIRGYNKPDGSYVAIATDGEVL